jgi:hypothetical protein
MDNLWTKMIRLELLGPSVRNTKIKRNRRLPQLRYLDSCSRFGLSLANYYPLALGYIVSFISASCFFPAFQNYTHDDASLLVTAIEKGSVTFC